MTGKFRWADVSWSRLPCSETFAVTLISLHCNIIKGYVFSGKLSQFTLEMHKTTIKTYPVYSSYKTVIGYNWCYIFHTNWWR